MTWLARFWRQPNRRYRNFQLVFTALTLNFLLPAISYLVDPDGTYERIVAIGRLLGDTSYPVDERSYLWRFLGVSDVFTLAFMCFLLQYDLRRFYPVLPALVVLKAATALQFLGAFLLGHAYRVFLAIGLFDGLTCVAFVWFACGAHASLGAAECELTPRPGGGRGPA